MSGAAYEKINYSNAKALRRCRELCKVSRKELAERLKVNFKTIEKLENGRTDLSIDKILEVLKALNLTQEQFYKVKRGKGLGGRKKTRIIISNDQRRSYQKKISKECRILKILRKMKGISQDQASAICGYSRPSIGHIENGRIELNSERIMFIYQSYGYQEKDFLSLMNEQILRDEAMEICREKIFRLSEEKLKTIMTILLNF